MNAPQFIYLALMLAGLAMHAARHGRPRTNERYNFHWQVIGTIVSLGLLWWGGFFSPSTCP